MAGCVYIVNNHKNGTLYIGVTSDLERRIYQHGEGLTPAYLQMRADTARLVRGVLGHPRCHPAREDDEAVVPQMEDRADRDNEPGLAGLVFRAVV